MGLYDDAGKLNYVGRCGIGENGAETAKLLKPASPAIPLVVLVAGPVESVSRSHCCQSWSLRSVRIISKMAGSATDHV